MGYKHGVWLVSNHPLLKTKHIPHFTVGCFMEKKDAFNKITSMQKFNKSWPASIIHKCRNKKIYIDKKVKS